MIVEPNKTNKSGMVEKFASAYRGLIYSRARAPIYSRQSGWNWPPRR